LQTARVRYLEDFSAGQTYELGSHTITREEILEFAQRYDPQPFHIDEELARRTIFGGLIASGWQTCAIFMRCYVDGLLTDAASLGSPGVDELRWRFPVRPGDTLTARLTVASVAPSSRKPDRGTAFLECEMTNQDAEVVLTMTARALLARRP
jgi:acyl dehydratase